MHRDNGLLDAQRPRNETTSALRRLRRHPDLELAIAPLRRAVLRLERCVRDERVEVCGLDSLCSASDGSIEIAICAQGALSSLLRERHGLRFETRAALLRRRAFVPLHLQLSLRGARCPVIVGDNCNTTEQSCQRSAALDDERVADTRRRAYHIQIRAGNLAAEH